jgi:CheY-like chemotaxis protein
MDPQNRFLRILVVEDTDARVDTFREWLPADVRLVHARSAGAAIGVLRRDGGRTYDGIMLDHDLQEQALTSMEEHLSGKDVVRAIIAGVHRDVPVLVHSMNSTGGPAMVDGLRAAHFDVTRVPMVSMTRTRLLDWLEDVRGLVD